MSDEYSIHTNFQRASDDPRAAAEYEHRMERVRQRGTDRIFGIRALDALRKLDRAAFREGRR